MKKNYFIAILALVVNFAIAQIEPTTYRGAFAASPTAPWTDSWTEFNPLSANYTSTKPVVVISADITANTTWNANNVYELNGTIFVRNNATLTIPAGTLIKSNAVGASLIVTRGAKLNAIGTATSPIVFTSKNAVGSRNRGDWGGIVLLGKGRYNINNGVNFIEGISQTVETQFGGGLSPINNDSSGTLKYVRIEFAGYVFSPNNELNGLTMGACGSGTTIDYVQVSYSNDDSFEWFGGSVDCKHLVALNGLDDDFDTDNGYNGRVQFGLSIKDPLGFDISTSECFESDNSAGTGAPVGNATTDAWKTSAIFTNFTCLGPVYRATLTTPATSVNNLHDKAARLRRATELKVFNSLFLDFRRGLLFENNSVANFTTNNTTIWQNNIIAGSTPIISTTTDITNKYNAGSNSSLTSGADVILVNPYPSNSGTTDQPTYAGLDYRPGTGSPALSGASFANAAFTGLLTQVETPNPIVTTPINYCKGAVAAPLTAVNAPGTSLRWYTALTGGTAALVPPAVLTTTVGTKTYYVTQRDNTTGVESTPRTAIVVNTLAAPAVALGTITSNTEGATAGTYLAATLAIGPFVGTTTEVTYRVPASTEVGVTSYVWTVPLGTTIISDPANTNVLTVNFQNVPAGAETYGTIGVQAVNEAGCRGAVKTVTLIKALPLAPSAIVMTDLTLPVPTSGIRTPVTSFAPYMGTNKLLTLTPAAVTEASSYVWELPTGVNPVLGTVVGTPTVRLYSTYPFLTTISSAPTAVGNVFYRVTETVYSSGIVIQTATRSVVGGTLANGVLVRGVDNATVTNLTNEGATINPAFPIVSTSSASRAIQVDFAGVTSANTFNYSTTAAVPVSTNVLRIGVKSRNGVGVSTTSNATLVNPTTTSTARLLTLTAIAPVAPASVILTNPALSGTAATTAITNISLYIGTDTYLTLTAAASPLASSYSWELPDGVIANPASDLTTRIIQVKFSGVAPGTTLTRIGVKAVNGVGSSTTNNSALLNPTTTSTAKLLSLASSIPAAPASVILTNPALSGTAATAPITIISKYIGTSTLLTLTAAASPLATSYEWEIPAGVTVSTSSNLTSRIIQVDFSTAPAGTTLTRIGVKAKNGVGSSITNNAALVNPTTTSTAKLLSLTSSVPAAVATVTGQIVALCGTHVYTITPTALANSYIITAPTGSVVTSASNLGNTSNVLATSDLIFSVTYPVNYRVTTRTSVADKSLAITSVNGVGNSATNKVLTLATVLGSIGTNTNSYVNPTTGATSLTLFGKCNTQTISVPAVPFATSYVWTLQNGATGTSTTNSIVVDFSLVATPTATTKNVVKVEAQNDCGVLSVAKLITLTFDGIQVCAKQAPTAIISGEVSQIYPNPAVDTFSIDLSTTLGSEVSLTIYAINGAVVKTSKVQLVEGFNTVSEDVSNLGEGIYFVKLYNATSNETIVRKLVKR
jgi:hypothetical protein